MKERVLLECTACSFSTFVGKAAAAHTSLENAKIDRLSELGSTGGKRIPPCRHSMAIVLQVDA